MRITHTDHCILFSQMTKFMYWLRMPGFLNLTELMHNGDKQKFINVNQSIINVNILLLIMIRSYRTL